jgi:hypothetical protein
VTENEWYSRDAKLIRLSFTLHYCYWFVQQNRVQHSRFTDAILTKVVQSESEQTKWTLWKFEWLRAPVFFFSKKEDKRLRKLAQGDVFVEITSTASFPEAKNTWKQKAIHNM